MFYNTYRATKSALRERELSGSPSYNRARLIDLQKKEKLKGLLLTKFCRKYGIMNPEKKLEDEISKFVEGGKLTNLELKKLEEKIKKLLLERKKLNNSYQQNLTEGNLSNNTNLINERLQNENLKHIQNQTMTEFNTQNLNLNEPNKKKKKYANIYEELAALEAEESAAQPKIKKIDFTKYGDEWNAINIYNKILFDQQQKEEALKEKEDKVFLHEALGKQIEEREKKIEEEKKLDKEYAKILKKHNRKLIEIEKEKERALEEQKNKIQQIRLAQMEDDRKRKKLEELREKKWERLQLERFKKENEELKEFEKEQQKKKENAIKEAMKETEERQKKLIEKLKKQKELDSQFMLEQKLIEDKKEAERKLYFKRIENKANSFLSGIAKEALEKMKREEDEERWKYKYYIREKLKKDQEKEELEKKKRLEQKNELAKMLEIQIEEKKKNDGFDKILDEEQGRILRIDQELYHQREREIEAKIDRMNKNNLKILKKQMEDKRLRENKKTTKMSPTEYSMNYKILEKVSETLGA